MKFDEDGKVAKSGKLDIKEFHDKCLKYGSMPLHLLENIFTNNL